MKRKVIPELLDEDAGTPAEIAASLRDLRRVNRWLGGVRTTRLLLEGAMRSRQMKRASVLEVGSGDGYVMNCVARRLPLEVTLLDRMGSHFERATLTRVIADARALPFADDSFDFVTCNLLLHHFEPDELREFVRGALRVCRVAVLINDLRRHWIHLALTYAGVVIFRSRLTRHDAPASVRRSYTVEEWRAMLSGLGAACRVERRFLFRAGLTVWKDTRG